MTTALPADGGEPMGRRRFPIIIAALVAIYALLAAAYALRVPLVMDEFQGAEAVARFSRELPYRDFQPYKTVLGYYVQLLPLMAGRDTWESIMFTKLAMVAINSLAIAAAATMLRRHLGGRAVCWATALLVVMTTFLERSAALRVDMLTAWFGLFGLLSLLDRRYLLAGLLTGTSFLVSQKGVYFLLSTAVALGVDWLLIHRNRATFRGGVRFAAAACAPLIAYFAFWSCLAPIEDVWTATFMSHGRIALQSLYDIRHFWFQTLIRNPLFYGLAACGLARLLWANCGRLENGRRALLASYGAALLALCIWHKQPWPYFFVLLIPTCYVMVGVFISAQLRRGILVQPVFGACLALAIIQPLGHVPRRLARDNSFQRQTVRLAERSLEGDETYLAGLRLLLAQEHALPELSWLDRPRLHLLRTQSPVEQSELVARLERDPPKIVIWNYRLDELPPLIRNHLLEQYPPFVGNLRTYGIRLDESPHFRVRFAGAYELQGPDDVVVSIDGSERSPGDIVRLNYGTHTATPAKSCRLRLIPNLPTDLLDARESHERELFPYPYQ